MGLCAGKASRSSQTCARRCGPSSFRSVRRTGRPALYAFDKERALLANIRAGDRNGARQILNGMLATIYMSSPQTGVLRARGATLALALATDGSCDAGVASSGGRRRSKIISTLVSGIRRSSSADLAPMF